MPIDDTGTTAPLICPQCLAEFGSFAGFNAHRKYVKCGRPPQKDNP